MTTAVGSTWHCHGKVDRLGPCTVRQRNAADLLRAPPVPGRHHPPCDLALPPVYAELPRCRGALGRARHRDLLRNRPALGPEVWASVRSEHASPATSTHGHLALG